MKRKEKMHRMINNNNFFSCCCGRLDKDHKQEATQVIPSSDVTWEVNRHTEEQPTNAYGELEFTGAGQTSRAKVSSAKYRTKPEN